MNSWIDLHALWRIVGLGIVTGAGLPAVFALGLRALSTTSGGAPAGSDRVVGDSRAGQAAAVVCFAVVLVAVAWGIYLVVDGS